MTTVIARRVPPDWQHPTDERGRYIGIFGPHDEAVAEWHNGLARWKEGYYRKPVKGLPDEHEAERTEEAYIETYGGLPKPEDHMPAWPAEQRTHWQMYELTSEGTPISPVCRSPEQLAYWLSEHDNDHCMQYSREEWLAIILPDGPAAPNTPSANGASPKSPKP